MLTSVIIGGVALMALGSPQVAYADMIATSTAALELPVSTSTVRAAVEREFGTSSVMVRVAGCESEYRQFGVDGKPLEGIKDPDDTGVFQINKRFGHTADAIKLGIDFSTLEGNITFARYLYNKNGTDDWLASKYCWG